MKNNYKSVDNSLPATKANAMLGTEYQLASTERCLGTEAPTLGVLSWKCFQGRGEANMRGPLRGIDPPLMWGAPSNRLEAKELEEETCACRHRSF